MTAVVLEGLRLRWLRTAMTAVAIVLGVAMISGTYVLMDTTLHAFDSLFATAYSKAQVVVVGKSPISGAGVRTPPVPGVVLTRIRALAQVQDAEGYIDDRAELRNAHGGAMTGPGTPLAFGVPSHATPFSVIQVVTGRRPRGPGEIAVDSETASADHLVIGSTVGVVTRQPLQYFRVVGIVRFGGVGSLGPIELLVFDLPVAQRLFDKQGVYDQIYVSSRPGVSTPQLMRAIAPLLPANAQEKTGAQEVQTQTNNVDQAFSPIRDILLAFAGIALFVGSFVIFNTLSVTVAQRTREFATLRTLGASRRQVLGSVLLEALVIGILASLVGLVAGLVLARGLEAMFTALGAKLPNSGTVLATRTVIVSLAAGIIVTLLASVAPALRATRVAPIAAVREGAILPPGRLARVRTPLLAAVSVAGVAILGSGLFAGGLSTGTRLLMLGGGAALLFAGLAFASRWLVAPLAAALGRPFERFAGATGMLARENTTRNTARTAITAGALTVGVALVAFVAVLGAGLRATINTEVNQQIHADYVVSASGAGATLPPAVGEMLSATPGVSATAVRAGEVNAYGKTEQITAVNPANVAHFYNFIWAPGSGPADLARLGLSGAIVTKQFAASHHLARGSRFRVQTSSGTWLLLSVVGIQNPPVVVELPGAMTISTSLFDRSFSQPSDTGILVDVAGGARAAAERSLERALVGFPNAQVQTVAAFIKSQQAGIDTLLELFYVLLALSIVVSLFGIVNTLALAIVERTREIGTLRAMGMTRRQVSRMIRIESEITALIGAVIGIVVGVALAALATLALSSWNLSFTLPVSTLVILLVVALFAGRLAARTPARRAAKLDPLRALQYE
ncbi:MAG TPA: FtsX-like permease family protein [Solirubrobacteraceae bacterium]|nr:FtsX-like permease family protein [Solirubrobacteraceae bacterium]